MKISKLEASEGTEQRWSSSKPHSQETGVIAPFWQFLGKSHLQHLSLFDLTQSLLSANTLFPRDTCQKKKITGNFFFNTAAA